MSYARNGDPIVSQDGYTKGTFVLAARDPDGRMYFGLTPETGFLVEVHRKPDAAQVGAFLADCMDGTIVSKTLDSIARLHTAA